MTDLDALRRLAGNVATLWTGGRAVLDEAVRLCGHPDWTPWQAARSLAQEEAHSLSRDEVARATAALTEYLAATTWFDRAAPDDQRLAQLAENPIAYFCMEYGLARWLPIYSGGLGVLAGDVLKESSDMGLPVVGVGLFYRHGFSGQRLDESGLQQDETRCLDPAQLPLEPVKDGRGQELRVGVPIETRTVYARAWTLQVGRIPLYLLDTDVPENPRQDDRDITATLYGGDENVRLRQEIVLGIGGVRLLRALGQAPAVFSMNEGHAALLGVELLVDTLRDLDFESAVAATRRRIVYTNHTVVPAGNDVFPSGLVRSLLGTYADDCGLGGERLLALGCEESTDRFSMAALAFRLAGKANAVSRLHAEVIPRYWPGHRVEAVTNGVHVPTWLGDEVRAVLDERVPTWQADEPGWDAVLTIPDERLWAAHQEQRRCLVDAVRQRTGRSLEPAALTLVWARRFAEYKRPWLIASDLDRLTRLLTDAERPVQLIISGKAHPRDFGAKTALQALLRTVTGAPSLSSHVVFIEDYDIEIARLLAGGADLWINTPRKPLEASGTSGMKASDNGALQLTVTDGWAAEVDWWNVGWGMHGGTDDASDAAELYAYLENSIVPCFFNRDERGVPRAWVVMMKNSMLVTLSRYSSRRMVLEYLRDLYLPLVQARGAGGSGKLQ